VAEQWTAEDPEFARAFRVVYPDGFTLDGAQFPSGRCVVDDRGGGLVEAATDIDSLGVRRPGDRIEWADAAVEWSVRFADGTVMSQIFTEEGARAHAALYTAAVDDPAEPVWRRAGPWQPASSGEQSDRTDWRREAELLDRTLTQAARRFVEVVTEREELRAELARVRAQVAAEIAEAIERNMAAHAWECAAIARQHAAPSGEEQ
jgi:hypothetical protein